MVYKRKHQYNSGSEDESTKKNSFKRQKFEKFLENLAVFHSKGEVEEQLERVIDSRIQLIIKKLNIPSIVLNRFTIPREKLRDEVADIVLNGLHPPVKKIIRTMPLQVEVLNKVNETASLKESLVELMKKKQEEEDCQDKGIKGPSIKKLISRLDEVRGEVLKMILVSLNDPTCWKDLMVNPMEVLTQEKKTLICQLIYSTVISFLPESFKRYLTDDDAAVYEELDLLLSF